MCKHSSLCDLRYLRKGAGGTTDALELLAIRMRAQIPTIATAPSLTAELDLPWPAYASKYGLTPDFSELCPICQIHGQVPKPPSGQISHGRVPR